MMKPPLGSLIATASGVKSTGQPVQRAGARMCPYTSLTHGPLPLGIPAEALLFVGLSRCGNPGDGADDPLPLSCSSLCADLVIDHIAEGTSPRRCSSPPAMPVRTWCTNAGRLKSGRHSRAERCDEAGRAAPQNAVWTGSSGLHADRSLGSWLSGTGPAGEQRRGEASCWCGCTCSDRALKARFPPSLSSGMGTRSLWLM